MSTAIDAWLKVHEVEATTLRGYEVNARRYIKPALGDLPVGKITMQLPEELYAQLRVCKLRCNGQPTIDHRINGEHECRTVRHRNPPGRPPAGGHRDHDCPKMACEVIECQPHLCKPLAPLTIRDIHFTISSVLSAAMRWDWIKSNPADVARKPRKAAPEPQPPTPEQAAQIVDAAWREDEDWGTFVWLTMVTGMRRAELLGLRWPHLHLDRGCPGNPAYVRVGQRQAGRQGHENPPHAPYSARPRYCRITPRPQGALRGSAPIRWCRTSDDTFVFSHKVAHDRPYSPDWVSHHYSKMCAGLGITSHLHAMRHYSATELLSAGVDL